MVMPSRAGWILRDGVDRCLRPVLPLSGWESWGQGHGRRSRSPWPGCDLGSRKGHTGLPSTCCVRVFPCTTVS